MPSDETDQRKAIESYFLTNWDDATPVAIENVNFVQPGTHNMIRQPWVTLFIRPTLGWQASIGNSTPLRRYTGVIYNQVFTDIGIGTETGLKLARNIVEIWRDANFTCGSTGRIWCNGYLDGARNTEPQITLVGDDGKGWFLFNVTTRFRREDYL